MPRLVVFHSPPDAVATYQTLRFRGSMAASAIRPEEKVPGMLRRVISRTMSAVSRGADAGWPGNSANESAAAGMAKNRMRFMTIATQYIRSEEHTSELQSLR